MTARRDITHPADKQALRVAVRDLVRAAGGVEAAEGYCRIGRSQLSDCTIPNGAPFAPIDVIADLEDRTVGLPGWPIVTRALAQRQGCVLVKVPDGTASTAHWLRQLALITKEGGEVAGAIDHALADDDEICARDAHRIIPQVDRLIEAALGLRRALGTVTG